MHKNEKCLGGFNMTITKKRPKRSLRKENKNSALNLDVRGKGKSRARCNEDLDTVRLYIKEISKYPLLTPEEEKSLSREIQENNNEEALNALINSNLRLVVKIAKSYVSVGYPLTDIIQDGNMGLIKAASKFLYKKNVRFSTYASWWIKQTIVRNLAAKGKIMSLSYRKEERLRKIKNAENKFYQKNKRKPSADELSVLLNIDKKEILDILSFSPSVVSMEERLGDDDNYTLKNVIEDSSFLPDRIFANKQLEEETRRVMNTLSSKERLVLSCRYGFNDKNKKYTLKKMSEMMGISAETVRQVELRALNKIRKNFPHLEEFLK